MRVIFHPEAVEELLAAVDHYEVCDPGLGSDFALETDAAIRRIVQHPSAWSPLEGEVRQCKTRRFPFSIVYAPEEDAIFVLAIMHLRRQPGYWRQRM